MDNNRTMNNILISTYYLLTQILLIYTQYNLRTCKLIQFSYIFNFTLYIF